jgi:hypothetical protein
MLVALREKKRLFRPFVFRIVAALGVFALFGHKVVMQSVADKARKM